MPTTPPAFKSFLRRLWKLLDHQVLGGLALYMLIPILGAILAAILGVVALRPDPDSPPPTGCTSVETSNAQPDVLATLQVVKVCPPLKGDITTVDGNHGADCMYDSTATGPVELTLQRPLLVNGLRIAFSGNAPEGSTMTVTLDDQSPHDIPINATLAPDNFTSFALSQSATTDRVTVTPPVGICHLAIGT